MKKLLAFLLLFPTIAFAQPFAFHGVNFSENVHGFLLSRIDSATVITSGAKDTVLITHGSASGFAGVQPKPFYIVMKSFTGNVESPFEVFAVDTAWPGSGTDPDTLQLIARNLTNSTVWSPHVWDTGTYIYAGSSLNEKDIQDSINYGLTHLKGAQAGLHCLSVTGLTGGVTYYAFPDGSSTPGTSVAVSTEYPVTGNRTLQNLYIKSNAAAGVAQNTTVTVYVNGAPQTLSTTIAGGSATTAFDNTHTVSVSALDLVTVQINPSALSTALTITCCFEEVAR